MEAAFAKLPAASTASKEQEDSDVRATQSCSTAGGPLSGLHVGAMTPVGESGRPQRNRTAAPNASPEFEASLRMLTDMGFEAVAARAALGKALGRVEVAVEMLSRAAPLASGRDEAVSASRLAADASAAAKEARCLMEQRLPASARGSGDARRETLETSRTAPALHHPGAAHDADVGDSATAEKAASATCAGEASCLSAGGVEALWHGDSVGLDAHVRVQLIGVTQLGASSGVVRYRVSVSDGRHSISASLATKLNPLVSAGHARIHTLVDVHRWERLALRGKKAIILTALDVVRQCDGVLGSPTPIEGSSAADPSSSPTQLAEGKTTSLSHATLGTRGAGPAGAPTAHTPSPVTRGGAQADDPDPREGAQGVAKGGAEALFPCGTGADASTAAATDAPTEESPFGTIVLEEAASASVEGSVSAAVEEEATITPCATTVVEEALSAPVESPSAEHVLMDGEPEPPPLKDPQPPAEPKKRKRTVVVRPKVTRASVGGNGGPTAGANSRLGRRASAAGSSGISAGVDVGAEGRVVASGSGRRAEKKRVKAPCEEAARPVAHPERRPGPRSKPAAPRDQHASERAPPCLALSAGISKSEAEALVASAAFLGATSCAGRDGGLPAGCTHVLVPDGASSLPLRAYFAAASRSVWVVRAEWIFRSLEAGGWLDEEPFEATHLGAVREARLAAAPPLAATSLCFWQGTALPHPVLRALAIAAGATVVNSARVAHYLITDEAAGDDTGREGGAGSDLAACLPAKLPVWLARAFLEGRSTDGVWHKLGVPSVAPTKWLLDRICPGITRDEVPGAAPGVGGDFLGGRPGSGAQPRGEDSAPRVPTSGLRGTEDGDAEVAGAVEDRSTPVRRATGLENKEPHRHAEGALGGTDAVNTTAEAEAAATEAADGTATAAAESDVEMEGEEDWGDGAISDEY